jgi:hypothetical protein
MVLENDADEFAAHVMPAGRELLKVLRTREVAINHNLRALENSNERNATEGLKRYTQLEALKKKVHKEIIRLEKEETAEKFAAIKPGGGIATPLVPESQIPEKITTGKNKFNNPYFQGTDNRYAGDPKAFNWTPQMLKMYTRLDHILTSRGLAGFNMMYASTARVSNANLSNFALFGAGGKVIWRKYDMGYGSGKNLVYIAGVKYEAANIVSYEINDPTRLDVWFNLLKAMP